MALGLVLLVVFVYGRTATHPFVDLDDGEYVYENPVVQGGLSLRGIAWALTTTHAANWHPLTWLSHMADVEMFGLNAGWHHLMNVLIHALNTVLLHYLNRGEFPRALECFMEAARIKPNFADAWHNAGVALGRLERYPRAIAAYREALRLQSENADGWVNLGLAYQATGRHAQAIAAYQTALRIRPGDSLALYDLALIHARLGDRAQALAAHQRLRAVNPAKADELARSIPGIR